MFRDEIEKEKIISQGLLRTKSHSEQFMRVRSKLVADVDIYVEESVGINLATACQHFKALSKLTFA